MIFELVYEDGDHNETMPPPQQREIARLSENLAVSSRNVLAKENRGNAGACTEREQIYRRYFGRKARRWRRRKIKTRQRRETTTRPCLPLIGIRCLHQLTSAISPGVRARLSLAPREGGPGKKKAPAAAQPGGLKSVYEDPPSTNPAT